MWINWVKIDNRIEVTEIEYNKAEKFRNKHWKKCKSGILYKIYPSAIGTGLYIKCNKCNKQKDITDYSVW